MNELFTLFRVGFVGLFLMVVPVQSQDLLNIKDIQFIAASDSTVNDGAVIIELEGGTAPFGYGLDNDIRGKSESHIFKIENLKPLHPYEFLVYDKNKRIATKSNIIIPVK